MYSSTTLNINFSFRLILHRVQPNYIWALQFLVPETFFRGMVTVCYNEWSVRMRVTIDLNPNDLKR